MARKKTNNYLGRNLSKKREPDKISKEKRSSLMSKIRSRGTKFEKDFIDKLKAQTRKRYKLNVKELKGKPDIVFYAYKLCVFLDSDFWHFNANQNCTTPANQKWTTCILTSMKQFA